MVALLLIDVGMAVAARTMPQVNMFIVGMPLKIFVGLTLLAISINYMSPLLEKIYGSRSLNQLDERSLELFALKRILLGNELNSDGVKQSPHFEEWIGYQNCSKGRGGVGEEEGEGLGEVIGAK